MEDLPHENSTSTGDVTPRPDDLTTQRSWCQRYFCLEQQGHEGLSEQKKTALQRRKMIALAIPAVVAWLCWWPWAVSGNLFHLFAETDNGSGNNVPRYYLSITMIFGSMIAGLTSEGGAAVAFPVMTLIFDIKPSVARDFGFMIQTVGMNAAAFSIIYQQIKVEWFSIFYVTIAGVAGIITSLREIDPLLEPSQKKMYFVCIWGVFALSLFFVNRLRGHKRYECIPDWEAGQLVVIPGVPASFNPLNWKAGILMSAGFIGGIFSGLAGSGIDICSFACLTLIFRVTERTATPTSVILMAINTSIGFLYRQFGMGGVEQDAWGFWAVCIPIVVIGAPVGAMLSSQLHRLTLAGILYVVDFAQLVGALIAVQPWKDRKDGGKTDEPFLLCATSIAIIVGGAATFALMAWAGLKLSEHIAGKHQLAGKKTAAASDLEAKVLD